MLDKVKKIENWYYRILAKRNEWFKTAIKMKAVVRVQRFAKILLNRVHERKMREMEESFKFFDDMKNKVQIES